MQILFGLLRNLTMNLIEKVKSSIDIWKLEKYTKRRAFLPEYKSKDLGYYKEVYCDGVYNGIGGNAHTLQSRIRKRASSILSIKSSSGGDKSRPQTSTPCSESYNKKSGF
ncbi:unnamed protein product [Mucor circinelloides]